MALSPWPTITPFLFRSFSGFSSGHLSLQSLPPSSAPGHLSRKETLSFYLFHDAVSSPSPSMLQTEPDSTCHVSSCTLFPREAQKLLTSRGQALHDSQMAMATLGLTCQAGIHMEVWSQNDVPYHRYCECPHLCGLPDTAGSAYLNAYSDRGGQEFQEMQTLSWEIASSLMGIHGRTALCPHGWCPAVGPHDSLPFL